MINEPTPFATKRRVGCVMWLSIAALLVSSLSILIDVTQELAWNARVEQAQALVAAPTVAENAVQVEVTEAAIPPTTVLSTPGTTYANVCDVEESNMTDPQINAHAQQWIGQRVEGWRMWVYDVTDYGTGQYNLELAGEERGLFWSRSVVIENIDSVLATTLNVEQQVTVSGRIDRVETTFEVVCNPLYLTDAIVTLADDSQFAVSAPAAVVIAPANTPVIPEAPTSAPTNTPLPPAAPVVVTPKDARDSLFVHGNNSPQLPPGESGQVSVIVHGRMQGSILPITVRNNTQTYVTRIKVSATARGVDGGLLATGGDQGITPNLVNPGEVAFGYLYFGDVTFPDGTVFEFQAQFEPAGSSIEEFESIRDLEVLEASLVETRLVGIMKNQYDVLIAGPMSVEAVCFDNGGQMLSHHRSYTDQDSVAAGATVPYQLDLYGDECPIFLITGSGFEE